MKIWKGLKLLFFKTDKHTKFKNSPLNSSKIYIGNFIYYFNSNL